MNQKNLLRKIILLLVFCTGAKMGYATVTCTLNPVSATCVNNTITLSLNSDPGGATSYVWSGTGVSNINSSSTTATPTSAGTVVYQVAVTHGNGSIGACSVTATYNISVTVNANVDIVNGSVPVCVGAPITLTDATLEGTWSSAAPGVATINSSTGVVSGVSAGTAIVSYTLNGGCAAGAVVTVNANPTDILGNLSVCTGNATHLTDATTFGTWSSASPLVSVASLTGDVTGVTQGAAIVSYALSSTGCYTTAVVNVNQTPTSILGSSSVCEDASIILSDLVTGGTWASGSGHVSVGVSSGVIVGQSAGTANITYTNASATCSVTVDVTVKTSPTGYEISTSPNPICPAATLNVSVNPTAGDAYLWSGPNSYGSTHHNNNIAHMTNAEAGVYTLVVTNTSTSCSDTFYSQSVVVNGLTASTGANSACSGDNLALNGTLTGGPDWASSYLWSGPGAITSSTSITASVNGITTDGAGIYTLMATSGSCTITATTAIVTVNTMVTAVNPTSNAPICTGYALDLSGGVTGGTSVSYSWAGPAAFSSGALNPSRPSATTDYSGVYTLTATANGCPGVTNTVAVTVNPLPTISVSGNSSSPLCNGDAPQNISFTSGDLTATFAWTNNRPSIGIASGGSTSSIPTFAPVNNGFTDSAATISVIAISAATTCTSNPLTFTLTVNPTPAVRSGSYTFCNGAASVVNFVKVTDPSITSFSWVSDNPATGTGSEGNANITFNATNGIDADVTANVTITPAIGACPGPDSVVTITVHPTPAVTTTDIQKCNGAAASITFSGPTDPLNSYTWGLVTASSVGLAAGSSPDSITVPFTATNASNVTVIATYSVAPSIGSCTVSPSTFTITVYPTPHTTNLSNRTYCYGTVVSEYPFVNSVAGTTYTWWTDNQTIFGGSTALALSGTTAIFPGFTATDTSVVNPTSATLTVVAAANGCTDTVSEVLSVNPPPNISPVSSVSYNQGQMTAIVHFSSNNTDTFSWSNNNTSTGTGLSASGVDSVGSFTTAGNGVSTFIVTPWILGTDTACPGSTMSFNITVNAFHIHGLQDGGLNDLVCNNFVYDTVAFTGGIPGTTYDWSFTGPNFGGFAGTSGSTDESGAIGVFTVVNSGTTYLSDTFTVNPHGGGNSQQFIITVRPSATVVIDSQNQYECNGSMTYPLLFHKGTDTAFSDVYSYSWTNLNPATLLTTTSGTGSSISSFAVTDTGTSAIVAQIIVTPSINVCPGIPVAITITVNPTPKLVVRDTSICNDQLFVQLLSSPTNGLDSFIWMRSTIGYITTNADTVADTTTTGMFTINDPLQLHNSDSLTHSVIYKITLKTLAGCIDSFTETNHVYPTPVLKVSPHYTCNNLYFNETLASSTPGASFAWQMQHADSISFNILSDTGSHVSDSLANSATSTQNIVFTATVTANGCTNPTVQRDSVWVRPTAHLKSSHLDSICSDATFLYPASSNVSDNVINYEWRVVHVNNNTLVPSDTTNSNNDLTGNIDQFISTNYSHTLDTLYFVYQLANTANNLTCMNVDTVKLVVKPTATKPKISAPPGQDKFCKGMLYQNFSSSNSDLTSLSCIWTVPAGDSLKMETGFATNCLIGFTDPGVSVAPLITDSVWVGDFKECASVGTYQFNTDTTASFDIYKTAYQPDVILYKDDTTLFCDYNDTDKVISYQWGYDSLYSLTFHTLKQGVDSEKNQDCEFIGVTDDLGQTVNITDADKTFCVKTWQKINGDIFVQKSYITKTGSHKPNAIVAPVMLVYPNPAHSELSFELVGITSDNLTVEIYDMLGKRLTLAALVDNKVTLSVSDLPEGSFIAICRNNGRVIASSHFVKN